MGNSYGGLRGNLSASLTTSITTSQKLTPQMQQAIKLLQLSSVELEQEVQNKLDSNPLLERIEQEEVNADDFAQLDANLEEQYNYDVQDNSDHLDSLDSLDKLDSLSDIYADANFVASDSHDDGFDATIDSENITLNDSSDVLADNTLSDLAVDTKWDDIYTHASSKFSSSDEEYDSYDGSTSMSLQDYIRWQLNFKHLSTVDALIASHLVDAMDDSGFISIALSDFKQNFDMMTSFGELDDDIELDQIVMVLHIIQSCEPLGVGARTLAECLQIQLKKLPPATPYRQKAINFLDGYELFLANNIKELIKATNVQKDEITPCLELIRTLNPAPGVSFSNQQIDYSNEPESYDIPDVLVSVIYPDQSTTRHAIDGTENVKDNAIWQIRLNPDTLPKLRVNQHYANLIKAGENSADNIYLRDNLNDARMFIRSIEERNQNLLKVATCIIKRQQEFIQHGTTAMKPLILKDIAKEVGLHESTVSRITTSKTILTPQGLFSLKHFFSSHVSSSDGDVSSTAISAMIKAMISAENPKKPLSDSVIQQQLKAEGIDIARRTVAKYREALNIASSPQRKVKF